MVEDFIGNESDDDEKEFLRMIKVVIKEIVGKKWIFVDIGCDEGDIIFIKCNKRIKWILSENDYDNLFL